MIVENGSRRDFKHCILWFVEVERCSKGHLYVIDPNYTDSWKRGVLPNVYQCWACQFAFENAWLVIAETHDHRERNQIRLQAVLADKRRVQALRPGSRAD